MKSKFNYDWKMSDIKAPGKLKVFGTFICGGGSSMGYKLAGFNHLGGVEIDPKIAAVYKKNLNPKYLYNEDIRDFLKRNDLNKELYNLDILDGSPPCSTFSVSGLREKTWNKDKKFKEGQKKQNLDGLFFIYLQLVEKLKPKMFIAENVEGLIKGNAKAYVKEIIEYTKKIGYVPQLFLLDAQYMGVPQIRRRVFFICQREDFYKKKLKLQFNYDLIPYKEVIEHIEGKKHKLLKHKIKTDTRFADINIRLYGKDSNWNTKIIHSESVCNTLTAGSNHYSYKFERQLTNKELVKIGTFPKDYKFEGDPLYMIGMSVPPVMMANIATEIKKQLFNDLE